MIPFSPPRIDDKIIEAVVDVLKSTWITTGPKTAEFEEELKKYTNCKEVICLNSASAGLELVLRWFGVGSGDEVILPAYTYAATANVVLHCGATPVFVDVNADDFNININEIRKKINSSTKVIMPVDLGGFPCDYDTIKSLVEAPEIKRLFSPKTEYQKKLGRILVLSDAAHSLGAEYNSKKTGCLTDFTVFSFHAVKNLTTAEGGAVCINLSCFDNSVVKQELKLKSLHGQNKDARAKLIPGNWKYDIVEPGYKCNMTDIQAAMGIVEIKRYDSEMLRRRREIFSLYQKLFSADDRFQLPVFKTENIESSYHVFLLRIKNINEQQRDEIIQEIFKRDVSVNVHFKPLPLMSYYKNAGYKIEEYPVAYDNFSREISLPVYFDLSDEQVKIVAKAVIDAVNQVCL
ncbi:MAG: DegT/DnrJ/EryC1/StrS family aminotransferase [Bacteroidales bacterium]|nr:DegT/DnrJ/EryC1/StrS family aminotransferase [Bacteroidales bacterium]